MIFEKIKTIYTSDELLDKAFKRSKRAFIGKKINDSKSKIQSYKSMSLTASNIISDNLLNIVRMFPNFDNITLFYKEIVHLLVDLNKLKQSLSNVHWASRKIHDLTREYISKLENSNHPELIQKQIFGRISSIVYSISNDLLYLNHSRNLLRKLPEIRSDLFTIIVSGYPNVGKSSLISLITNANIKIASYPFTTTNIAIGHFKIENILYQIIDTPGLLDRPMDKRNSVELQSIIALKYLSGIILYLLDPSEECGYSIDHQVNLLYDIKKYFPHSKILVVSNKYDKIHENKYDLNINVDCYISSITGYGIKNLFDLIKNNYENIK